MTNDVRTFRQNRPIETLFAGLPDVVHDAAFARGVPSELPELRRTCAVTQAVLVEGRHRVRVWAPAGSAPEGFERVAPTLEDAYLVLMRAGPPVETGTNGAQAPAVAAAGAPLEFRP